MPSTDRNASEANEITDDDRRVWKEWACANGWPRVVHTKLNGAGFSVIVDEVPLEKVLQLLADHRANGMDLGESYRRHVARLEGRVRELEEAARAVDAAVLLGRFDEECPVDVKGRLAEMRKLVEDCGWDSEGA